MEALLFRAGGSHFTKETKRLFAELCGSGQAVVIVSVPLLLCDWVRELRFTTEAKMYREFPIQVHPYKIARSPSFFILGASPLVILIRFCQKEVF